MHDTKTGASTPINSAPVRGGQSARAVCLICNRRSAPVALDRDGEPSMWKMARGWSTAPYPADFEHRDGSRGSTYTCPACNKRLRAGERLRVRGGGFVSSVSAGA